MKIHTLEKEQLLPITLEFAWDFFSNPSNLNEITPEEMSFNIKTPNVNAMYPGMLIEYQIRPLFNIPMSWVTEITHVKKGAYFIDEQRFGPYKLWHHEHHFKETPNGILVIDKLSYGLSFGLIGKWINRIIVSKRVNEIFEYRYNKLNSLFNN